jgi:CRISPR-associated exonuclease Cas4
MTWIVLAASVTALVLASLLRQHAAKRLAELDLAGEIVYSDDEAGEVLVSERYGLTGKPDYIRKEGEELIPVERKSRHVAVAGAHEGEILQLAAYCLLAEERYGTPVRRGQILYSNRSVEVPFDEALRARVLDAIADVKATDAMSDVPRDHNSPARCRGCGFRRNCGDSLV